MADALDLAVCPICYLAGASLLETLPDASDAAPTSLSVVRDFCIVKREFLVIVVAACCYQVVFMARTGICFDAVSVSLVKILRF